MEVQYWNGTEPRFPNWGLVRVHFEIYKREIGWGHVCAAAKAANKKRVRDAIAQAKLQVLALSEWRSDSATTAAALADNLARAGAEPAGPTKSELAIIAHALK